MIYFISIISILFFGFNFYQDVKYRSIYLINIPISAILILSYVYVNNALVLNFHSIIINVLIITTQVLGAWLFILITKKKSISSLNNYIAVADIFFLFLPVLLFPPIQLVIFELIIMVGSLVFSVIIAWYTNNIKHATVPLAGIVGLGLAIVISLEVFANYSLTSMFQINY